MNFRSTVAIALLGNLAFMFPASAAPTSNPLNSCPVTKRVYTAIGKPDYKAIFAAPPANSTPDNKATVTLQHTKRGNLGTFVLGQGQGYGTLYMTEQTSNSTQNKKREFILLFFDSSLKAVQSPSSTYMHIVGLGVSDAYSQQNGSREYPLGDVMWQLSSCRK